MTNQHESSPEYIILNHIDAIQDPNGHDIAVIKEIAKTHKRTSSEIDDAILKLKANDYIDILPDGKIKITTQGQLRKGFIKDTINLENEIRTVNKNVEKNSKTTNHLAWATAIGGVSAGVAAIIQCCIMGFSENESTMQIDPRQLQMILQQSQTSQSKEGLSTIHIENYNGTCDTKDTSNCVPVK